MDVIGNFFMQFPVVYLKIEAPRPRLLRAQKELEKSISFLHLDPLPYPAGKKLVPLGNLLERARKMATGKAIVWVNSDVILTKDPFDVPNPDQVYGFQRRELPSLEICCGVDMFYIPIALWDNLLCQDIPKLFLGASYVDRWIPSFMEHVGAYENLIGYIDHHSHPQSAASGKDSNGYYQSNFNSFNRWARRQGMEPIPEPPVIPWVGHVGGVRDALKKIKRRLRTSIHRP